MYFPPLFLLPLPVTDVLSDQWKSTGLPAKKITNQKPDIVNHYGRNHVKVVLILCNVIKTKICMELYLCNLWIIIIA